MNRYKDRGEPGIARFSPAADNNPTGKRDDTYDLPLLLREFNHRIRNILGMIEAVVGQTQSTTVAGYRKKLLTRISGLGDFYEVIYRSEYQTIDLAKLLERTIRPHCAASGRVIACGPTIELGPKLALSLHLVVHELATNAMKYGALSSIRGTVNVAWEIQPEGDAGRKLAVIWNEAGGPQVKISQCPGFGTRLIARALSAYGEVRLDFRQAGVACYMLIDLDRDLEA